MTEPRDDPRTLLDPDAEYDPTTHSTRPIAWPGIPGPEQEHRGTLATHPQDREPPARVTQAQQQLEEEVHETRRRIEAEEDADFRAAELEEREEELEEGAESNR